MLSYLDRGDFIMLGVPIEFTLRPKSKNYKELLRLGDQAILKRVEE